MRVASLFLAFFIALSPLKAKNSIRTAGDKLQIALPVYAAIRSAVVGDFAGVGYLAAGVLATQGAVETLKVMTQEKRPQGNARNSFPSGHTAAAFSAASYLHARYGLAEASVPYLIASFVAYSRVQAKRHYIHDVVAGALLASGISFLITSKYENVRLAPVDGGLVLNYERKF